MSRANSSYQILLEKLDRFTRKYYVNQLIRGSLYTVGLLVLCFLAFALAEHLFYFGTGVRKLLFFSFLLISAVALFQWIALPIVHYFKLGKIISHEKAAEIIGLHFEDVKDKLINILHLNRQADSAASRELVLASIDQKTAEIQPVPFQAAIDLRNNRRYLPYALPPLLLLLALLIAAPSLIKDPTHRILKNSTAFEREAPFYFHVENESLDVPQYEDFQLSVSISGEYLPEEAFVTVNGFQYRMKQEAADRYSYVFNNVQQDISFSVESSGVTSKDYSLHVLKKPNILNFTTELDYPAYINRRDEQLSNVGDLVIPQGTKVDWIFQSVNTERLDFVLDGQETEEAARLGTDSYTISKRIYRNGQYKLVIGNEQLPKGDSISYTISVIPDLHPTIGLKQFVDSADQKLLYLVGDASDDYGLTRLTFNYHITNEGQSQSEPIVIELNQPTNKRIGFDHVFDVNGLELRPGDQVNYYFEVWDNDGVSGRKSSRTSVLKYAQPTKEEFEEKEDSNEEEIKRSLEKAHAESEKIRKEFKQLREKALQQKSMDWQMKKELEDLLDRQKSLENEIQEAKDRFDENLENQPEFEEVSPEMQEKQERLQEMFEELADEETRELMEKISELLEELEKDEALKMMEDMEMNEEELSMELERLKELFKQLELERDLQQEIEKLQELAEEQKDLSEKTDPENLEAPKDEQEEDEADSQDNASDANQEEQAEEENQGEQQSDAEEDQEESSEPQSEDSAQDEETESDEESSKSLEEQQQDINEAFEEIRENLEELQERNEELQAPKEMGDNEDGMQDIEQDLNQSLQQLQKNQKKSASKSQKNASQKMQQMAEQMQQQMEQGDMEQMEEDMAAMRQLLENLVTLSFEQEDLMGTFNRTHTSTPKYTDLVQNQHKLEDDFHLIEDSLTALSQRVYQIESFVLEKVAEVKGHMKKSIKLLEDRKKAQASDNQQRTMKNVNDLALMFSESMNQMQQQMAAMMSGSQMCTKPGGGKPKDGQGQVPMDKISKGQQELNGEMQKMKEGMDKGGQEGSSKEFATMAAKQAALRKALRDLQREKQSQGKGSKELEQILEQMDHIETDLVNKRLTNEMLKRQQDILTRLLESERAEREREYENKRESKTAEEEERQLPPSVEEYIKQREAQIEPFKKVSPALKPYYKQLVEEYYKSLKEN